MSRNAQNLFYLPPKMKKGYSFFMIGIQLQTQAVRYNIKTTEKDGILYV